MARYPAGWFDLLDDLSSAGCATCRASQRSSNRWLDGFLYENVNDPGVREELRRDGGFCREHVGVLLQLARGSGEGLGVAILYKDLIANALALVDTSAASRRRFGRKRGAKGVERATSCKACRIEDEEALVYLGILASAGADSDVGRAACQPGRVLCLPHLQLGLSAGMEAAALVEMFKRSAANLDSQLGELIRKEDHRFRGEEVGDEGDSWWRAPQLLVGRLRSGGRGRD